MKSKGLKETVILALALGVIAGVAQAQLPVILVADIPFNFTIERTTLPAGKYEFQQLADSPWEWTVADAKGAVKVIFTTDPTDMLKVPKLNELVFDAYGDKDFFLAKVWIEGMEEGFHVAMPKAEKAIRKAMSAKSRNVPLQKKGM
jgi:hypothetical protein